MDAQGTLTIGDLARQADVNVETIRYYESIGLLRQPAKPARGWQRYGPDAAQRLRFIKRSWSSLPTPAPVRDPVRRARC